MLEEQKDMEVPEKHGAETAGPSQSSAIQDERSATPLARLAEAEVGADAIETRPLHRAGTLPPSRSRADEEEHTAAIEGINRKRGRTISARPNDLDTRALSPRSQLFKRQLHTGRQNNGREGSMDPIPERRQAQSSNSRPRRSTNASGRPSQGMRPRMSTWAVESDPLRQRGSSIRRRHTILTDGGLTTGRDMDTQSATFTLAGPAPTESVASNQPYVDPGYAELNPAYDQPINSRPVWGLAKPLPRVIRPGMVSAKIDLEDQVPEAEQQKQYPANVDLEAGRVQATPNVNKTSPQLQQAGRERENSHTGSSKNSPSGRKPSSVLSNLPQVIEAKHASQQDLGTANPHSDLNPVVEQPTPDSTRPGSLGEHHEHHDLSTNQVWELPDDASSITTAKEREDALDGDWIGEEHPLKAYDPETDEIHNIHTHWSVIRLRFREPLAELLAVTVQLTLGFCADLVVVTSNQVAGNEATTDWAWGLATMVGIYIAGGISGAHLNPAISIMLCIFRGFPLRKVPIYIAAQLLGAFLAGLISFGLYQKDIIAFGGPDLKNSGTLGPFITYPRYPWIDASTAFFTEFTGTAILSIAVLALGDDTNAPPGAGMNAFILGLVITVLSMAFGYNTGAAMNGARDLGPRLACLVVGYGGEIFRNGYWVYGPWVATVSGAVFGAFLYDAAIFVGGESPVNYPRRRIGRVGRKFRGKWVGRLRRARRGFRRGDSRGEEMRDVGRKGC